MGVLSPIHFHCILQAKKKGKGYHVILHTYLIEGPKSHVKMINHVWAEINLVIVSMDGKLCTFPIS